MFYKNISFHLRVIKSYISCFLNFPYLYARLSYAQEGEDIVIERYFKNIDKGYFIDIGAYHPYKYSNTFKLYHKGWTGINIEPNFKNIRMFNFSRKKDINLNMGIAKKNGGVKYYQFSDDALNTFNVKNYNAVINSNQSKLSSVDVINTVTISELFTKCVKDKHVDLLNIDTEGSSFEILRMINLKKIKIEMIVIERSKMGTHIPQDNTIIKYLIPLGYILYSSTTMTHIFIRKSK